MGKRKLVQREVRRGSFGKREENVEEEKGMSIVFGENEVEKEEIEKKYPMEEIILK